jgi:hypothetical protein
MGSDTQILNVTVLSFNKIKSLAIAYKLATKHGLGSFMPATQILKY